MPLIVPEESQRPYRFGMTLVCIGALFNWLGLADHHTKPVPAVRYIGVGLVASGAVLICMAMCFWMNSVRDDDDDESVDHVHVISLDPPARLDEKPPDYATVVDVPPPSYDDAIKLDAHRLLVTTAARTVDHCGCGGDVRRVVASVTAAAADTCAITVPDECDKSSSDARCGTVAGCDAAAGVTVVASQQQQQQQHQQHQQQQHQQQQSSTTTLAQAIRKSIRDIRKQLTNTVSDSAATTDVEQQHQPAQHHQPQQPVQQHHQPQQLVQQHHQPQQLAQQHHRLQQQQREQQHECGPEQAAAAQKYDAQTTTNDPTST